MTSGGAREFVLESPSRSDSKRYPRVGAMSTSAAELHGAEAVRCADECLRKVSVNQDTWEIVYIDDATAEEFVGLSRKRTAGRVAQGCESEAELRARSSLSAVRLLGSRESTHDAEPHLCRIEGAALHQRHDFAGIMTSEGFAARLILVNGSGALIPRSRASIEFTAAPAAA